MSPEILERMDDARAEKTMSAAPSWHHNQAANTITYSDSNGGILEIDVNGDDGLIVDVISGPIELSATESQRLGAIILAHSITGILCLPTDRS